MSMFKIGNNFDLLYLEKESCETFYRLKVFKDMKHVTYSTEKYLRHLNLTAKQSW